MPHAHRRKITKLHAIESNAEAMLKNVRERKEAVELELELFSKVAAAYIKKNPLKSTAMAGVVGILIGKLLK